MGYVSYISYGLSPYTKDIITVAQIYCNEETHKLHVSKERLKILKGLVNPLVYNSFKSFIQSCKTHEFTIDSLEELSIYQTGIIRVTPPSPFAGTVSDATHAFKKYIDYNYKS